jgi:hypothetical protein
MSKQIGNLGTVEDMFVKIKNLFRDEFKKELAIAGKQAVEEVRKNSPEKNGIKGQDIFYFPTDDGYTAQISAAGLAVDFEFGTGTSVDAPDGLKGDDTSDSDKKEQMNIRPQPFIYPAAVKHWNLLYEKLWTMLDG